MNEMNECFVFLDYDGRYKARSVKIFIPPTDTIAWYETYKEARAKATELNRTAKRSFKTKACQRQPEPQTELPLE